MMKKQFLSLVFFLCAISLMAQSTAADIFTSAPQSVIPLLDRNTRLDMVDYFESGMATPSTNLLDGHSSITELTPESITVKMTGSSAMQIVALKGKKDSVIAVINTVAVPGLDSKIEFYDMDWNQLSANRRFSKPDLEDWLTEEGRKHKDDIFMQVPFMLSSYRIDPSTSTLTLTNNLSHLLDKDVYNDISVWLQPQLTYVWTGSGFKSGAKR